MTDTQRTQRTENRGRPATEIEAMLPAEARPYVYRVGAWLWAEFPSKPSAKVRGRLLELGFSWNITRGVWQHNGGIYRHASKADPRAYYGVENLEESDKALADAVYRVAV